MIDDSIVLKIKKLKNLTSSNNPAEAALAAEKMQELLIKYNVDIKTVDAASIHKHEDYTKEYQDIVGNGRNRKIWQLDLARTIAVNNLCRLLESRNNIIWIGKKSNIEACQFMLSSIAFDLERIADANWEALSYLKSQGKLLTLPHGKRWKASFFAGAVNEISNRLYESSRNLSQSENVMALITLSGKELQEAQDKFFPKVRHVSRASNPLDSGGYNAGRAAGKSLQFKKGIGGQSSNTKLIK